MNKKILVLILMQVCVYAIRSLAQTSPCANTTVTCVTDQHIKYNNTYWHASHGSLVFSNSNSPTSPAYPVSQAIQMSSELSQGNGVFTCYKFDSGKTYHVCFWVRNVSGWPGNWFGRLYVYAAADLETPASSNIPTGKITQLIDDSYLGPAAWETNSLSGATPWEFVSTTFTANWNFNCLWMYPDNPQGPPPPGFVQWNDDFVIEVDDIRVSETPVNPYNFSVSDNKGGDTINSCGDTAQITVSGMDTGYVAYFTDYYTNTYLGIGSTITVSPCNSTVYKIDIADTTSDCGKCGRATFYDTVNVSQWSEQARILYPDTVVPCTTTFTLQYDDPGTCPAMANTGNYTWIEPDGVTTHVGKLVAITNANAYQTGQWTLKIQNSNKGCAEIRKFTITIGSCCISTPSFSFSGTNPVHFLNTGSGITYHVSTLWSFGDGTSSTLDSNPIHTYADTGIYMVCMTTLFEDGQGQSCCNRACAPVVVSSFANSKACIAVANFNYKAIPGWGNTFDFTDASSGNGSICTYFWDFGDGTTQTTTAPAPLRHTFITQGPWYVCLTVTNCVYDAAGNLIDSCKNTYCMMINPVSSKITGSNSDVTPPSQLGHLVQSTILGISNTLSGKNLTVYPNPNDGNFTLLLRKRSGNYKVVIRDNLRRVVYNEEHTFNRTPVKISLSNIANGVYSVEVKNDKEIFAQQVSIIK